MKAFGYNPGGDKIDKFIDGPFTDILNKREQDSLPKTNIQGVNYGNTKSMMDYINKKKLALNPVKAGGNNIQATDITRQAAIDKATGSYWANILKKQKGMKLNPVSTDISANTVKF